MQNDLCLLITIYRITSKFNFKIQTVDEKESIPNTACASESILKIAIRYSVLKRKPVANTNTSIETTNELNRKKIPKEIFLSRLFNSQVGALSNGVLLCATHKVNNNTLQMLHCAKVGDVLTTVSSENTYTHIWTNLRPHT